MKVCKKCNKSYLDDSKFCEDCGSPLELLQEVTEGKQVKKILKPKKLATVENSERAKKVLPKPLKRVKPLVRGKTDQESEQNKGIDEILLEKFLIKPVTVVDEPKTEEPKQVTEPELVVEEYKSEEPKQVTEPEPVLEESMSEEQEQVIEPALVVEEYKSEEPMQVTEPESVVEESKSEEQEQIPEPESVVEESKSEEPAQVAEPEPVVEESKTEEPAQVAEQEPVVEESKTEEPAQVAEQEPVVEESKSEEQEQVAEQEPVVGEPKAEEFAHDYVQNAEQGKKKGIKVSLIFAAVGFLALIGVSLFFLFGAKSATYIKCKDSVSFQQEGGKYFLDIDSDGEFDVIEELEWITASVSDNRIEIVCSSNKEGFMRQGTIKLSYGSQSKSVDIIQKGIATYIKLSPENLVFSSKGGTEKVVIDTDGSGLNIVGSGCEIKNRSASGFDVYVDSHSGAPRTGKITVFSGNVSTVMTFYQKGLCGRCQGSGKVVCTACSGSGKVQSWYNYGEPCSVCAKSGSVSCPDCSGTGEK